MYLVKCRSSLIKTAQPLKLTRKPSCR